MSAITEQSKLPSLTFKEKVAVLGHELAKLKQLECPLKHFFAPGVYVREITMPAGAIVIGKIHRTEHLNIIEKGRVTLVGEDGSREVLEAPCTFISKAGVQKVLYIHVETECVWKTIHPTEEQNVERLEQILVEPIPPLPSLEQCKAIEELS